MLNYIERELRKSGKEGPAQTVNGLRAVLGKDIPFPISERTLSLEQATREYKNKTTSPELLTQFMRSFWAEAGQKIEQSYVVSEFPLRSKEIKERAKQGQMAIYVPEFVSKVDLGKMFPKMGSWAVREGSSVDDVIRNSGCWLWIEASVDAPNRNTTQRQLEEKFKEEGKQGQSLKSYIVGSQISKLLTDKYFDQGPTWSRLLGSCVGGVLDFRFDSGGRLGDYSGWGPGFHDGDLGGRSEEVVKA